MNVELTIACVALSLAVLSIALQARALLVPRRVHGRLMAQFDVNDVRVFVWLWNEGRGTVRVRHVTLVARLTTGEMYATALVRLDEHGDEIGPKNDAVYILRHANQLAARPIDFRTACVVVGSPSRVLLQLQGADVTSRLKMAARYGRWIDPDARDVAGSSPRS